MPQIRKRASSQYQARVHLTGSPEATRTFPTKAEAVAWAASVEKLSQLGHGESFKAANRLTLHDALTRYGKEVTPSKKGFKEEGALIRRWEKNPLAAMKLAMIRGADIASYR